MTLLAGPTVAYKDYDNFITGANFTQATNNKVSNDNNYHVTITVQS